MSQSGVRSCFMPGLPTHLVQELHVVTEATHANEILNVSNKRPNGQINIENQHLGKCRFRCFGLQQHQQHTMPTINSRTKYVNSPGIIHDRTPDCPQFSGYKCMDELTTNVL